MGSRDTVAAVVLAAGRSRRMGQAKQLLPLGGSTLLARSLANVLSSAAGPIVLVLGFAAEQIQRDTPTELLERVTVMIHAEYAEGMSSSLRAGLAAVGSQADAALIVLADQPFVRPETMDAMIEAYRKSSAEIVVPYFKGQRGNPVLLDRSVFPAAMNLEGDIGFRAIFGRRSGALLVLDVDDEGVLLDIDNREDYERIRSQQR